MEIQSKLCSTCGKQYYRRRSVIDAQWERSKYCSRLCTQKDKKSPHLVKYQAQKGTHLSKQTEFKKGEFAGERSYTWKGDEASYAAIHLWASNHFGKPQKCEHCGTTEKRMYHWANISGTYRRERTDWLRLCVPCHKNHDIKALGGKIKARTKIVQPRKICAECSKEFSKQSRESGKQWDSKLYCGRKCGAAVSGRKRFGIRQSAETGALKSQKLKERWATNTEWRERVTAKMRGNQFAKKH
jgi:hypothetical protein